MSEFSIGRKQLFILPSRHGWYFALILMALFGIAIKFNNQAAFMMLFILVAMGLVAMLYTNNNVAGLSLRSHSSQSVFVGESAIFPISIINRSDKERGAIWLICGGFHQLNHLDPGEQKLVEINLPTRQRGYLNCSPIVLSSQFPIGIFFAWSKQFHSQERCLVYPQPIDFKISQQSNLSGNADETEQTSHKGNEDYAGLKDYQAGDRLRDIHWPSLAKTSRLIAKEYESQHNSNLNFSWFSLPKSMNTEDKLSQLSFWVMQAEQGGSRYQLEMPNHTVLFDRGTSHMHECLRTLALWEQ